ncbi:MAG: T9SS type A sorting domain-containing protein, partial [Bacteroidota bacterium]
TVKVFNLNLANPTAQPFAAADSGFSQAWGLKSDGTVLLSLLDNADFSGGAPGPAKLVEYNLVTGEKNAEWDLPANSVGHTVSIVDGKYYVTDFGTPRIMEVDPGTGTVNDSWFTSPDWDPMISGIGGTIYNNDGGFYVSQGNKLWYVPISNGMPGTMKEVTVSGLTTIDADGITWVDSQNTLYYATNDTGDPNNVGTVYQLIFSDDTTAMGSEIANGFDDSSGLWYYEQDGSEYLFVIESQFGALFGLNDYEPPFNIEILDLANLTSVENTLQASANLVVAPNPFTQSTTFEVDLNQGGVFQFQVFDIHGRNVTQETMSLRAGINQFAFDGGQLAKGLYSYRLSNPEGFISGKMIITH